MSQDIAISVGEDEKAAFDRDGVVCLRNVLTAEEIERLRAGVARQMAGLGRSATGYDFEALARQAWDPDARMDVGIATRFDMSGLKDLLAADPAARPLMEEDLSEAEGLFFYDAAGWRRDAGIREVALGSALPEIAAGLMAAREVRFWEDTTFVKAPHTRQKTAFHQDLAYFQVAGDQCLIAWAPLDPAGPANGVTEYVRGSHKWGKVFAPNIFLAQTPFPGAEDPRCPNIEGNREAYDIVSFDVRPGDVILHHVLTVHGAGGNRSDTWRRAVSFRYCGEKVRYLDRKGATPQVGTGSRLRDGDALDGEDYPLVWPRTGTGDAAS